MNAPETTTAQREEGIYTLAGARQNSEGMFVKRKATGEMLLDLSSHGDQEDFA